MSFKRSKYDPYVYYKGGSSDKKIYLLLYSRKFEINEVKKLLSRKFDMKDLRVACKIIGMEITRNKTLRELYVCQSDYGKKIIKRFNMFDVKAVGTPLAQYFKLSATDSLLKIMKKLREWRRFLI